MNIPHLCQNTMVDTVLLQYHVSHVAAKLNSPGLERAHLLLVASFWPAQVWFYDLVSLMDGTPWEIPVWRDFLSQVQVSIYKPLPEISKLWV